MPKKGSQKKLPKWAIWSIVLVVIIVGYYLWKRHQSNQDASIAPTDPNQGLASAYIGGVPTDNSFATTTDLLGLQSQLSQMQLSMIQLGQPQPSASTTVNSPQSPRHKRTFMPIETTSHTGNTLPILTISQ